jgi:hypothetical protein
LLGAISRWDDEWSTIWNNVSDGKRTGSKSQEEEEGGMRVCGDGMHDDDG